MSGPMVVLTVDDLRAKRAETQAQLSRITSEPSPFYVGDRYIADAAVASVERARQTERLMDYLERLDRVILAMTHRSMLSFGGTERYPRLGCAPDAGDDDEWAREVERAALLPDDASFADDDPDLDGPMPIIDWCDCGAVLTDPEANQGSICAACVVANHSETEAA